MSNINVSGRELPVRTVGSLSSRGDSGDSRSSGGSTSGTRRLTNAREKVQGLGVDSYSYDSRISSSTISNKRER